MAVIGDSFVAAELDGIVAVLAQLTGWDIFNCAQGGTDYANPGAGTVFGSASRLSQGYAIQPDFVLVVGSINDKLVVPSAVRTAAAALFAELNANLPGPCARCGTAADKLGRERCG